MRPDPIGLKAGGIEGIDHLYVYVQNNPIKLIDPFGLSTEFQLEFTMGGGVGYYIVGGGVCDAIITEKKTGKSCHYIVKCIGIGVSLPSVNFESNYKYFSVPEDCQKCSIFEGNGYIGGYSLETPIGGVTGGGGVKIPNGPFIPGKFIEREKGGINIGVSHSLCHWSYIGAF